MTERGLTTIDQALAELERLKATLTALRLMPEAMPADPIDLAMTRALRGLNFEERDGDHIGLRYVTNDVAGFDRIEVAWSREYLWHRGAFTVRVWGQKRPASEFEGSSWFDLAAVKMLEIPCKAATEDPAFARTLFAMISGPEGFEPFKEAGPMAEQGPLKYPRPGEAHDWPGAAMAYTVQMAKGSGTEASVARELAMHGLAIGEPSKPTLHDGPASLLKSFPHRSRKWDGPAEPDAETPAKPELTDAERQACEALDKGKFW